jgi:predicted nucleic acid-binding protein
LDALRADQGARLLLRLWRSAKTIPRQSQQLSQRLSLPPERILAYVRLVLQPMNHVAPSPELMEAALLIRRTNGFAFYDSQIIAAA